MATLTVQELSADAGQAITTAAADVAGDEFDNSGGNVSFEVNNGSGASVDVTLVTQQTVSGLAVANRVVSVAAGTRVIFDSLPRNLYNDSNSLVQVTYSAVASVTVAAWK